MICVYDSETTGLPVWNEPSGGDNQPHLVQLSALLIDPATQEEQEVLDLIIKPDGWTIPQDVIEVHGITNEYAAEHGVDEKWAVEQFLDLVAQSSLRVAHNEPFDARMIRIGLKRYGTEDRAEAFKTAPRECTARMSTKIINLPPTDKMMAAGRKTPKTPKLEEAYQFFFGEKLEGAHDGLIDARACARVYFEILSRQGEPA